jgi:hypothetical protein
MDQSRGHYSHGTQPSDVDRDLFGKVPKKHRDWSHRRGEPRVLALLWMIYLMGATVVMFASMSRAYTISYDIARPAARTLLVLIAIGFGVLWPMVRLSQVHPRTGHVWFVIRDVFVLFIPLQAILWPLATRVLSHWPLSVVLALDLLCLVWLLLIAGVLAMGMRSISYTDTALNRSIWMGVVLVTVFAAPLAALVGSAGVPVGADAPRVGWLLSPISGMQELVRDRDLLGISAKVYPQQIRLLLAVGCVGLALLLIARALEVAHARVRA